jgi:hypothetical protein
LITEKGPFYCHGTNEYTVNGLRGLALVPENDDIAGAGFSKSLICIDLEPVVGQRPHLIILVLEIDAAVVVLKGPDKGQAGGVGDLAFCKILIQGTGAVGLKDDPDVFITTCDLGIERVEHPFLITLKTRFLIFPRCMGEQFDVMAGRMDPMAGADGQRGP